jgi:hypothetical protein
MWAINGPLYQPQMVDVEIVFLVEWEMTEETEVLGENQPHCHCVHYNSTLTELRLNSGHHIENSAMAWT